MKINRSNPRANSFLTFMRKSSHIQALLVVVIAMGFGLRYQFSSKAFTGNHASCTQILPATGTTVKTGQVFSGTVKMLNDGTTTYSATYGYYLRDISPTSWNFQHYAIGATHAPGTTTTFNLTLTAPSTAGAYNYTAQMAVGTLGVFGTPCPTQRITVIASTCPAGQTGTPPNCVTPPQTCPAGQTGTPPNCAPVDTGGGGGDTGGGGNNGGGDGGYSGGGGDTSSGGDTPSIPEATPDTVPPSAPTDFKATKNDTDKAIVLSWQASKDNVGVSGYEADRSEDQQNWEPLQLDSGSNTFSDATVSFGKKYFYRLRAYDEANNFSGYATADVESSGFQANIDPANDGSVDSDDHVASISISAGTFDKSTFCIINNSADKEAPAIAGYKTVNGPYELICRDSTGNVLSSFTKDIGLTIDTKKASTKGVSTLVYYAYGENKWDHIDQIGKVGKDHLAHINIGKKSIFVILGKKKTGPAWPVIITVLLIVGVVVGAVLFFLRYRLRSKYTKQYQDYLSKERGF